MKCTEVKKRTDDYLDGQLSELEQSAYQRHVSACPACAQLIQDARMIADNLPDLPVPEPSANFEQRVFEKVRDQYNKKPETKIHVSFATGFVSAAIAGLVIWLAAGLFIHQPVMDQPQLVSIAMNETQTVRLMFESQQDFEEVSLSIGLPENMELHGYPGRRELSWKTSLQKGQNVLELPVLAVKQGQGLLVAKLNYGEKEKSISLLLTTTLTGAQLFQNAARLPV